MNTMIDEINLTTCYNHFFQDSLFFNYLALEIEYINLMLVTYNQS